MFGISRRDLVPNATGASAAFGPSKPVFVRSPVRRCMKRARSTAAGSAFIGLLILMFPSPGDAAPFSVTEIKVLNGQKKPDVAYMNHWFLPGDTVEVEATVRRAASKRIVLKLGSVNIQVNLEFVPGPGQPGFTVNNVGGGMVIGSPSIGQSTTQKLSFPTPSKEGLYKVRIRVSGGPNQGAYLGNSLILIQSDRPVLLIRRARVLQLAVKLCSGGGGLGIPTPLLPIAPDGQLDTSAASCTAANFARVKVENVGSKPSGGFHVIVTDTSLCSGPLRFVMAPIAAKKSAWVALPKQFDSAPGSECSGPYIAAIAPPPNEGGSTGASDIVFPQVEVYRMKSKSDQATINGFLANN